MGWFGCGSETAQEKRTGTKEPELRIAKTVRGEVLRMVRYPDDDDFFLFALKGQKEVLDIDVNDLDVDDENSLSLLHLTREGDLVEFIWSNEEGDEEEDAVLSIRNETLFPPLGAR
jgi:hypothetical protein